MTDSEPNPGEGFRPALAPNWHAHTHVYTVDTRRSRARTHITEPVTHPLGCGDPESEPEVPPNDGLAHWHVQNPPPSK